MSARPVDTIVIGGGADGLVAATMLARDGVPALVLEQAEAIGGTGRAVEFAPGFRAAPLASDPGWLPPVIAAAAGIGAVETGAAESPLTVVAEPGRLLTLSRDASRAAEAIRAWSGADATAWPAFIARLHRLASFLGELYLMPAPDVDARSLDELLRLAGLGLKFRGLGRADMIELLRTLPMSVWELLDDTFESGPLKAAVAAGGVLDFQQGPRSGGTGFVLLHHLVGAPAGSVRGRLPWRGGPGAFATAAEAAARRAGVQIRTGAAVERIVVRDDAACGVVLAGGEEIAARAVLSTASPARTLLDWVDPVWLDPELLRALQNIRHRGCTSYVLFALDVMPTMRGLTGPEPLGGTVSLTPDLVTLEKAADAAKYGHVSERPHVEITVPTLRWPDMAPERRHVVVARVQYTPYHLKDGVWDAAHGEALGGAVAAAIEAVAPGFGARVLHRVTWTPLDLERRFGLRHGASSQGELGLDQILFMRPIAGWSRHAAPVAGLYLAGAGTHPGPGVLGGSGCLAAHRLLADRRARGNGR